MNKKEAVDLALKHIAERKEKALDELDKRLSALRKNNDWNNLEHDLRVATVAVAMGDSSAKSKLENLQEQQAELLKKYHYSQSDLKPKFCCKKCNDTGFVDNKPCECLNKEIRKVIADESAIVNKNFTFENSTENNEHNLAIYKASKKVCEKNLNLLLLGNTGSGKTYLLTACANYCVSLGKTVYFATAYGLNSTFLQCHLGDLQTKQLITETLADVDVLVIDDLGTENTYKNVTSEYLFVVINERIARGKQTFISSNLTLEEIRDKYDERIFSRLVDQKTTKIGQLVGVDKRLQK